MDGSGLVSVVEVVLGGADTTGRPIFFMGEVCSTVGVVGVVGVVGK